MFIKRNLNLAQHLQNKSILLLGPRRTGKSSFIKNQIKPDLYINLLEASVYSQYAYNPSLIQKVIKSNHKIICIDEIQKLPLLMDEVHSLIEKFPDKKFILTGSSAKNLKKSHTSLMAGRARQVPFFPFTYNEVKNHQFNLNKFLLYGGLPEAYLSVDPWNELKDYSGTYLTKEIQASAFVRKIENYSRFLKFSALSSGELLNFENLASDAMISSRTIKDYYQLLEETLIGYNLPAFRKKNSRKEISTSKFYFFDNGVLNAFIGRKNISEKSPEFGNLFEHFIFHELNSYQKVNRFDWELEFWRTHVKDEVDFILGGGEVAIEVKASSQIKKEHLKGLLKFKENHSAKKLITVCQSVKKETLEGVEIYPWQQFIEDLHAGLII